MKPFLLTRILGVLLLATTAVIVSPAQINSGTNTGWRAWESAGASGNMLDPANDQQTGQGQDDFAGDATYAALQSLSGEASFDTGVDYMFIRARMNTYTADDQWGNGGNWGVGMDLDGDGDLDLIMMFTEGSGKPSKRTREITFGDPGTAANDSPSTTSWTFPTQTAISLTAGETYNVANATTTDSGQIDGDDDAWVTFGISFADLETAIQTYAKPGQGVNPGESATKFSSYTLDYNTRIAFTAFTSTQDNALNQDLAGTDQDDTSTSTWAELGALTPEMGPGGYIPEPGTYAQMGAFLLVGGALMYRRKRNQAKLLAEKSSSQSSERES